MPADPAAPAPRKRQAMTASQRQAKYRQAHKMGGIYLSEGTRAAINALQARMGLDKEAVVARAIKALAASLDAADAP